MSLSKRGQLETVTIFLVLLLIIGFGRCYLYFAEPLFNAGVDDANIFFSYRDRFLNGEGLVWSSGGPRVEGFTSPIWLIVCIVLKYMFGGQYADEFLMGTSVLLVTLTATLCLREILNLPEFLQHKRLSSILLLLTAYMFWMLCSTGYLGWMVLSLMDTALWSIGIVIMCLSGTRYSNSVSDHSLLIRYFISLSFVCLIRPEGVVLALVSVFGIGLLIYCYHRDLRFVLTYLLKASIVIAITEISITVARLLYFGYPFPNTFYAKVGYNLSENIAAGFVYAASFFSQKGSVYILLILAVMVNSVLLSSCCRKSSSKNSNLQLRSSIGLALILHSFLLSLAGLVFYILVGGDHFAGHRQFQAFWPLIFICLISPVVLSNRSNQRMLRLINVITFALFLAVHAVQWNFPEKLKHEFRLAQQGRDAARTLNLKFEGHDFPSVGVIVAGGFGLLYRGETIDLMGLNNIEMAHSSRARTGVKNHAAFNPEIFYKQSPDMIVNVYSRETVEKTAEEFGCEERLRNDLFLNYVLKGIVETEKFTSIYQPRDIRSDIGHAKNSSVCAFVKRSLALPL